MELIIGGSGSGKSAYAEARICVEYEKICKIQDNSSTKPPLYYIATMMHGGEEIEEKIRKHQKMREGKGFHTLEWHTDFLGHLKENEKEKDPLKLKSAYVLLECVSNLTANEMYMNGGENTRGEDVLQVLKDGILKLAQTCKCLIVVTNDVFLEPCPSKEMEEYLKVLGELNQFLAFMSENTQEIVAGIPCTMKKQIKEKQMNQGEKILIVGGSFQGKKRFAESIYRGKDWICGETCELEVIKDAKAVEKFHSFIKRWLSANRTLEELISILLEQEKERVIICDEVGCGIVPIDPDERQYREAVGRVCSAFAKEANRIYRVICGIGQRLQ